MPLSPIDVQQQTFKVALRGYAEDEVDEFLDEVVISLRDYEQRLRDAQERVAVLEEQLTANRETEDAMRRTFLVAQRTADAILEEAKADSERLLADAHNEVERVSIQQGEEKAHLLAETALLRDRVHGLRASLSDLAGGTLRRLDDLNVDAAADRITALGAPIEDLLPLEPEPEALPYEPQPEVLHEADDDAVEDVLDLEEEVEGEFVDLDEADEPESAFQKEDIAFQEEESAFQEEESAFQEEGDDDYSGDVEDDDDDDGVEIAKVPDWMTRDDSSDASSEANESRPAYRRPWERDEG